MASAAPPRVSVEEWAWPASAGRRVVFLFDASSRLERRLLREWIDRHRPADLAPGAFDVAEIPPSRRGRRRRSALAPLEVNLALGDDPILAPLRVAWLARRRDGIRSVRFRDLLSLSDPRDPGLVRQWWIVRREPDRCRVVPGEPAPLSELRDRWRRQGWADATETTGLAEFVSRQAALALERAERRLRGARYKVPRFVREEILSRAAVRAGLTRLAHELGRSQRGIVRDADRHLREIAARHSPFVIDLAARLCRFLYSRGYSQQLAYDREELERIYALGQRHPLVFLPSHKSNLDHVVIQSLLHENGLPPNHTAGGINLDFFLVGTLFRRSGVFFIRRSFKDNPLYKFVLRQYIDYLIEKRFSLEWYIEGGRSRLGKLLPPRLGLLTYVVDSYRRGKSDDVILVPVSIAYDQIQDVGDYVLEQRGGSKERESLRWFYRLVRGLRQGYGTVHIRFGEPLSLRKTLGPPDPEIETDADRPDLDLQKLAFEVCFRINRATPITRTSLITLAMLGVGDRAVGLDEMPRALDNTLDYLRKRQLPTAGELDLDTREGIHRALEALARSHLLTAFVEGPEPVYSIGPEQGLAAAYYRNTILHYFLGGAIAELALLGAAEEGVEDPLGALWAEALRLRDLLKFEFFFPPRTVFRAELGRELTSHDPAWETHVRGGGAEVLETLRRIRPFSAHRVLRPFLEAYQVVGDTLEIHDPEAPFDEEAFLRRCMGLGKQYQLQRRVRNPESVSKVLFETALRLAQHRELVTPDAPDLPARRHAFAEEIRGYVRRVEAVDALAASRRAGLID